MEGTGNREQGMGNREQEIGSLVSGGIYFYIHKLGEAIGVEYIKWMAVGTDHSKQHHQ